MDFFYLIRQFSLRYNVFFPFIHRIFWHTPYTFFVHQNLAAHPWFVVELVFVLSREQCKELLRYPYLLPW